jgi:putative membrane protein
MLLCLAAGIALAIYLVLRAGWADVAHAVGLVGWSLLGVVAIRALALSVAGTAWAVLLGREGLGRLHLYVGLRFIRDGANVLLPLMMVGGDVVGARLLTFYGVPGGLAGASVLIDVLLQAATQFLFTLMGFAALVLVDGSSPLVRWVGTGLLLAAPLLLGFFLAQRFGLVRLVERWLVWLGRRWPAASLGSGIDLDGALRELYRHPGRIAAAIAIHLLGWLVGVGEILLALAAMGRPADPLAALVIESLVQAVRGAAFAVPGALGVQEGGFVVLGALFGIPQGAALALSVVKRVPDVALGIPALLAWQALETRWSGARRGTPARG